ncbi:MAG: hypothetical protein GAK28_00466 [Luteibacter sp.]|nr:MAG: hypothetical protein GAK28_00466 [Luteibacter sp.]
MRSDRGITFDVRPSPGLALSLRVLVVATSIAMLLCGLPLAARVALCAAVLCHGEWRVRACLTSPLAWVGWASDGVWTVVDRHGEAFPAELCGSRVVGTWVSLRLRWQDRTTTLLLMDDNVAADDRRRLRVRLGR